MGCFLACFGFKEKKKRRKPCKKNPSGQQDHRSYVPLDSDASNKIDIQENITSDSNQLKEKAKEPAIVKIKKKVSFNLNVKAYEPIPHYNDDDDDDDDDHGDMDKYLCEGEEGTKWEFNTESKRMATLHYEEEDAIASSIWTYPTSHRYQNCRDNYDEEDNELMLEENELDFDGIEDSDDDEEVEDVYSNQNDEVFSDQIPEHLEKKEVEGLEPKSNVRDRSQYVSSVLNPVENLSQWKQVKAKAAAMPQLKMCQKENLVSKQRRGDTVAVDASLSNWFINRNTTHI